MCSRVWAFGYSFLSQWKHASRNHSSLCSCCSGLSASFQTYSSKSTHSCIGTTEVVWEFGGSCAVARIRQLGGLDDQTVSKFTFTYREVAEIYRQWWLLDGWPALRFCPSMPMAVGSFSTAVGQSKIALRLSLCTRWTWHFDWFHHSRCRGWEELVFGLAPCTALALHNGVSLLPGLSCWRWPRTSDRVVASQCWSRAAACSTNVQTQYYAAACSWRCHCPPRSAVPYIPSWRCSIWTCFCFTNHSVRPWLPVHMVSSKVWFSTETPGSHVDGAPHHFWWASLCFLGHMPRMQEMFLVGCSHAAAFEIFPSTCRWLFCTTDLALCTAWWGVCNCHAWRLTWVPATSCSYCCIGELFSHWGKLRDRGSCTRGIARDLGIWRDSQPVWRRIYRLRSPGRQATLFWIGFPSLMLTLMKSFLCLPSTLGMMTINYGHCVCGFDPPCFFLGSRTLTLKYFNDYVELYLTWPCLLSWGVFWLGSIALTLLTFQQVQPRHSQDWSENFMTLNPLLTHFVCNIHVLISFCVLLVLCLIVRWFLWASSVVNLCSGYFTFLVDADEKVIVTSGHSAFATSFLDFICASFQLTRRSTNDLAISTVDQFLIGLYALSGRSFSHQVLRDHPVRHSAPPDISTYREGTTHDRFAPLPCLGCFPNAQVESCIRRWLVPVFSFIPSSWRLSSRWWELDLSWNIPRRMTVRSARRCGALLVTVASLWACPTQWSTMWSSGSTAALASSPPLYVHWIWAQHRLSLELCQTWPIH